MITCLKSRTEWWFQDFCNGEGGGAHNPEVGGIKLIKSLRHHVIIWATTCFHFQIF